MDQLVLGGTNQTVETIDFGGMLDWQRNDASPVLFKGPGKYIFRDFDARTFGGDSVFEMDLPKASKLPPDWKLEIEFSNVVGRMSEDESGLLNYHTRPRFFESGAWGGWTKLTINNLRTEGLAGLRFKGGMVDAIREGKLLHINGLEQYDPNPDVYAGGKVLGLDDIDFDKYPELVTELEPIRKFAALERFGDIKRGNEFVRHAINLRYFFGLITETEDVLIENMIINTLQRFPGDEVKQLKRLYADLCNTMVAADPSTIVRDGNGAVVNAGIVIRNAAILGHYTPEQKNSGTHFITDQVNATKVLGLAGAIQNGGYYACSQGTLFHRCLSVQAMNASHQAAARTSDGDLPGFPKEDQGNYFTDCRSVAASNFIGLEDEYGNPVRSQYNSRAFGNYPVDASESTEFSYCKSLYYNTRRFPGISNFVIDGKKILEGQDDPTGRAPMTGPRANENLFLPESEIPTLRKEWTQWLADFLPDEMAKNLPFIDQLDCEQIKLDYDALKDAAAVIQAELDKANIKLESLSSENDELKGKNTELLEIIENTIINLQQRLSFLS